MSALVLSALLLCLQLTGCGAQHALETHMLIIGGKMPSVWEGRRQLAKSWERPVDFSFRETEPYTLMLALGGESLDEYELRLYRADGQLLQRIPCGRLASERPIEVPRYTESRGMAVLTDAEEDAGCRTRELYCFNYGRERMELRRSWRLREDTGFLEIWDYLENRSLFSGAVLLDEAGEPANREYYDMLLWENLYALWEDTEAESTILTGVWDSDGQLLSEEEYESREALLAAHGFAGSTPLYEYRDGYQKLQLELYRNEDTGECCGIVYSYGFNSEWEEHVSMSGFCVRGALVREWDGGWQDYSVVEESGYNGADSVEHYEEIIEYTSDGKPDYYKSQGLIAWEEGCEELTTLLKINHIYRDDGTLFYREYHHNPRIFYTTLSNLDSFFDESGRVVYESGYITHGRLERYYIYEEDGDKPVYGIFLDYNPEGIFAEAVRYN